MDIKQILFIIMGLSLAYGIYFSAKKYMEHIFGKEQTGEWPEKYTRQYRFLTYSSYISDEDSAQVSFKIYGNGILVYEGALEDCPSPLTIQLQNRYPFVNKSSSA